jgi:hypothetical protein
MIEKDGDKPEQDKRFTKSVLKTLCTHNTKSNNRQTSPHIKQKPVNLIQKSLKIHIFLQLNLC